MKQKNLHLIISILIIVPVAIAYGLLPNNPLPALFDFAPFTTDIKQIFRAIMGLYLSMAILWTLGIWDNNLWRAATISNVFFMAGLAAGRMFSLIIDGIPSYPFCIGLIVELALALWGTINYKTLSNGKS